MILSFVRTPYTFTTCIWRRMKDSIMRHHLINQIKTILQNSLIYRRLYLTLQSDRRYRVYYKTKISTIVDRIGLLFGQTMSSTKLKFLLNLE